MEHLQQYLDIIPKTSCIFVHFRAWGERRHFLGQEWGSVKAPPKYVSRVLCDPLAAVDPVATVTEARVASDPANSKQDLAFIGPYADKRWERGLRFTMIHEMLGTLPDVVARMPAPLAAGLAGAGALLGLFGARYSRGILTLSLVAVGTVIGLHIPKWFGWHIDPMGPAVGAAIVLGLSGYALTQMWEAIFLGSLLAAVAGAVVCNVLEARLTAPTIDWSATAVETTLKLYHAIPTPVNKALPAAVGIGLALGWLTVTLWPRFGRVLFYGLAGMITFAACGTVALTAWRPAWIDAIPADQRIQIGGFVVLVLVAGLVQWMGIKGPAKAKPAKAENPSPEKGKKAKLKNEAPALAPKAAGKRFGSSY